MPHSPWKNTPYPSDGTTFLAWTRDPSEQVGCPQLVFFSAGGKLCDVNTGQPALFAGDAVIAWSPVRLPPPTFTDPLEPQS